MSFCSEQKREIINNIPHLLCCKRAMLEGILASRGAYSEGEITVSLADKAVCELTVELVREIYSKEAIIATSSVGGRLRLVRLYSPSAERFIDGLSGGITHYSRCAACSSAFLRGVFLAAGRISDPEKQY